MAYGILPDPVTGGAVVYRDVNGNPTFPPDVQNAYSPPATFISTCELTALPADCDGRFEAKQANAIVSEMLSLAECWDANGPWDCNALNNLCTSFNVWWADNRPQVDNISIVGAGTIADPYRVALVDGGTNAAPGPQTIQIRRTSTANDPPVGLTPGELVVEMASDPVRLWVGVPAAIDPTERKLLVPQSGVVVSDTPPSNPILNQLWWESDSGILWLWYNDGTSAQWVQVSSGGTDQPDLPTDADEVTFIPGGGLSANDVQEALIELDAEKVAKAGDTMTGLLTLSGAPTVDLHAATKLYVDTGLGTKIGDAPNDGQRYVRQSLGWVVTTGGAASGVTFAPTGNVAATNVQAAIAEVDSEKIADAPSDGNTYGRRDGTWIVTAAGGGGPVANAIDIAFTPGGGIAATNVQAGMAELDTEKLAKAGGTMTGVLTLVAGAPVGANDAANKTYVDGRVLKTGDTMTGDLVMGTVAGANSPFIRLNSSTGAASTIQKVAGDLIIRAKEALPGIIITDTGNIIVANATIGTHVPTLSQMQSADALKLSLTGGTMTGKLIISGNVGADLTGQITTYGWGGNNNSGVLFLNQAQNRYLLYDGTNYVFNAGTAHASNGRLWGATDGTPLWNTGGTVNGALTVTGLLQSTSGVIQAYGAQASWSLINPGANPNWAATAGADGVLRLGTNNGSGNVSTSMFEWHVDTSWWISTIAATAYKVGGGPWADSSDARIKDVTGLYEHGLAELKTLNPVRFRYKGNDTREPVGPGKQVPYDNSSHHHVATTGQEFIGLIAQDAEKELPETVTKRSGYIDGVAVDDIRDLDTGPLIFALINAVKSLAARVEALEGTRR